MKGLIVDLFAGGGGASTGIEAALGRRVDLAVNHSATALAVHEANHPATKHLVTDVFEVDPVMATQGRRVDLLWASPDCTHFSVAKGGKPKSKKIRSLAEVVVQWAQAVRPRVIITENVREFLTWGPLDDEGDPIEDRAGELFNRWRVRLELLGYTVEWRVLDASDYGAPTRRKRIFIIARCDGQTIEWPAPTHGRGLLPYRTAAECIDWSLPCPSIFERKKPLAPKTMARIAAGVRRFVLEAADPFIVKVNHGGNDPRVEPLNRPLTTVTAERRGHALVTPLVATIDHQSSSSATFMAKMRGNSAGQRIDQPAPTITAGGKPKRPGTGNVLGLVAPTLIQTGYGERPGQRPRDLDLHAPLGTVVAGGAKHALVGAFLSKHFGDPARKGGGGAVIGSEMNEPIGTVTTRDHHSLAAVTLAHFRGTSPGQPMAADVRSPLPTITAGGIHVAEVRAFLAAYYGTGVGQSLGDPLRTVVSKDRFGLVVVDGIEHVITDIGMRMLEPHELLRAQFGRFADSYDMSAAETKAEKVRLIGNSVCPEVAEALVSANIGPNSRSHRRAA